MGWDTHSKHHVEARDHLVSHSRGPADPRASWPTSVRPRIIRSKKSPAIHRPEPIAQGAQVWISVWIGVLMRHIRSKQGGEGTPIPPPVGSASTPHPKQLPRNTRSLRSLALPPTLNPKCLGRRYLKPINSDSLRFSWCKFSLGMDAPFLFYFFLLCIWHVTP